ncbi:MAG TPA: class I SAM-dependent methyltransferase, partial [Polyangia bacterium]
IVDIREAPLENFALYEGTKLPCADRSYDVVLLNFVLHHLPNEDKLKLLAEARRIARRRLFVFEDTPRTPIDWLAAWLHGRKYRRQIGSSADFGFYNKRRWEEIFHAEGLAVTKSASLSRFERLWWRPWVRSYFVLEDRTQA